MRATVVVLALCSMFAIAQEPGVPVAPNAAQRADQSSKPEAVQTAAATEPDIAIPIGKGDLLKVSVYGVPEMEREVRVGSTGEVTLPLIGRVHVEGLTPPEAEQHVGEKFVESNYLRNPQVSVFIKEYATQGISVLGEVDKPGIYTLLGPRRLLDIISAAGGLTPKAGRVATITRRTKPDEPMTVELPRDPAAMIAHNVPVGPGDTVVIGKAGIVYVVGEVRRPGGYVLESERTTVLQAIALAEGLGRDAKLDAAKLVRRGPNGVEEHKISLSKILAAKQPDMEVQAEDIIFVPNSLAKSAGRRTAEAIVQAAVGVAIWRR